MHTIVLTDLVYIRYPSINDMESDICTCKRSVLQYIPHSSMAKLIPAT